MENIFKAKPTDNPDGASTASTSIKGNTIDTETKQISEVDSEASPLNPGELMALSYDDVLPQEIEFVISEMSDVGRDKQDSPSYGNPLAPEEAAERMPPGDSGIEWKVTIIPDNFYQKDGKLIRGLRERDFDKGKRSIKPCRGSLMVSVTDFFLSLTKVQGEKGPRWIFHGELNGWPSLTCLELLSLERQRGFHLMSKMIQDQCTIGKTKKQWTRQWRVEKEGLEDIDPSCTDKGQTIFRAKVRGAPWSAIGWSRDSPGFAFWFEAQHPEGPRLSFGSDMIDAVGNDKCTFVHIFSHRYAVLHESRKDALTYHSLALLEWEHGQFCSIVEVGYLNGVGGYKGKCNHYHGNNAAFTDMYRVLPREMIAPWITSRAEIRCYDVQAKNLDEYKSYVHQYEGNTEKFIDPRFTFSHPARLSFRSKSHIAQYLLNYIGRDCKYQELKRNCQTFVADFCSFLCGKKGVQPFSPIVTLGGQYHNKTHTFLYDWRQYDAKIH